MKTIKNIEIGIDLISIVYLNDIGAISKLPVTISSLITSETTIVDNFKNMLQGKLDILPQIKAKIYNVLLLDGIFFIQGESYPPQSHKVSNLSTSVLVTGTSLTQKQASDNLYSFVLSATGSPLVSLSAPFGTNTVVINGVTMNYTTISTASGSVLANATQLAIDLFNQ